MFRWFIFNPNLFWEISNNDQLIIGFSDKYHIEIWNPIEGKISSFKHEYSQVLVKEKDKKKFFSKFRIFDRRTGKRSKGAPDRVVKNTVLPRVKPPHKGILTDSDGNIWVDLFCINREEENQIYDVFSSKGKYIKTVKFDKKFPGILYFSNVRIRDDSFWLIERNDESLFEIIKYQLSSKK